MEKSYDPISGVTESRRGKYVQHTDACMQRHKAFTCLISANFLRYLIRRYGIESGHTAGRTRVGEIKENRSAHRSRDNYSF